MKQQSNPGDRAAICAGMALLAGSLLGLAGQAGANPQTTPPLTLAPYVLKGTLLEEGPTSAYRPWFENGAYTGDLIEYHISQQGERCTSVGVGLFPADDSANSAACPHGNWSARGAFPDKIVGPDGTLVDEPAAATYWQDRNVVIFNDGAPGNKAPFWWDELTDAQRHEIDPITCGLDAEGTCAAENFDQSDPEASIVLNFVRGDRSVEADKPGGIFRLRYSLLSAIINSRPAYVPVGDGLVVVGANDGMVHGFSASNGSEVFGYVPSMFFPALGVLTRSPVSFRYFADGEIRYRDIGLNRHIVAGGLGAGGKGLFALDVATPGDPEILFELSGSAGDHIAGEHVGYLGHVYGRPTISRLPDNEWYIVSGNGYGSGHPAQLVLIRISDGQKTPILTSELSTENGLSAPALVDTTGDGRANFAYAGDLLGNMWRFNLTTRTASKLFSAGTTKPITAEPDIARHPTGVGVMVYFGTGKLLNATDAENTAPQSVFGIWDETFTAVDIQSDRLIQQTLTEATDSWAGDQRTVRVVLEESAPVWNGTDRNLGWRVNLPKAGERLLGRPQVRAGRLQFVTTNPASDYHNPGVGDGSWFIQLSLESGGSLQPPSSLYDLDRSGVLDAGDGLELEATIDGVTDTRPYFPLALNLGTGNIAQPAFARVIRDIDAVYVNALLIPPPPTPRVDGAAFGGDIDVTTDSPAGPLVNPHAESHPEHCKYAVEGNCQYGTTYPDPSSPFSPPARGPMNLHLGQDGLGNRVDGHHRAYDKVHGVKYVDYFALEPRRDKLRLDAGTVHPVTGQPFFAIQELNGPTDNLHGNAMFEYDQKFIVVLSNADLSQGTELQIGCRRWNSFAYQEMITPQLKAGVPPADLRDENGHPLVFTLADILSDAGCARPTLRITITGRVGAEDVLHGTLPGCVNNTHGYDGQLKLGGTHPHITPNQEQQASGYRWRNGALTMQLLAVNPDDSEAYDLQPNALLPQSQRVLGNGGIYANAFTIEKVTGKDVITPLSGPNGLLYESSVFWNFGDMWEFQQQGQGVACYGASTYNAARTTEIFGLNSGQYNGLVEHLRMNEALQDAYAAALDALVTAQTEEEVEAALLALAVLFKELSGDWGVHKELTIADYHRLRSYAHGDQFKLNWLDMDRDLYQPPPPVEVELDGTPADVRDIEADLLPAAGPNYAPGRRSWIDITPN